MTGDLAPALPVRFLRRRTANLAVRTIKALFSDSGFGLSEGIVLFSLLAANVAHLRYATAEARLAAEGLDAPGDGLRRPVRTHALALSLGQPPETVRRKVTALERAGLVRRTAEGFIVPAEVAARGRVGATLLEGRRLLLETVGELVAHGVDLDMLAAMMAGGAEPATGASPPLLEARMVVDTYLRVVEQWRGGTGAYTTGFILCALLDANTNHIDTPGQPLRYAHLDDPPPDAIRRPAKVGEIAAATGLPHSTLARRLAAFAAEGVVQYRPGAGYVVPTAMVDSAMMADTNPQIAANYTRLFVDLWRGGRRFAAVRAAA